MAASFKCELDGTEIKVRRFVWKEFKELQKQEAEGEGGIDFMDEVLKKVILEPQDWEEKITAKEARKIVDYAMGILDEIK